MKLSLFFVSVTLLAADPAVVEKGRAEERRSCIGCHGVRLTHTQRLSRGTWEKELDKMVRWGAQINDRASLMEYLVDNFGDDKPIPVPVQSAGAAKAK